MSKISILVIAFALVMFVSCTFSQDAGESICLIADGYEGPVFIVFDQQGAPMPKIEEGRRVYLIPPDGILRTAAEVNFQIQENEFYYVNAKGERRKIEYLYPGGGSWSDKEFTEDKIDITKNTIYVFSDIMGGVTNTQGREIRFRQFLVGKPKDKLKLHLEGESKVAGATGAPPEASR